MSFRIVARESDWGGTGIVAADARCFVRGFDVHEGESQEVLLSVRYAVGFQSAVRLFLPEAHPSTPTERRVDDGRLRWALELYALPRIEAGLRDGSLLDPGAQALVLLTPDDADGLPVLLREKDCRYLQPGADAFCRAGRSPAASRDQVLLPTTVHLCQTCSLPDNRVVCSELQHVRTWEVSAGRIDAYSAFCGINKLENPGLAGACRPGGRDCWRRVVEPQPRGEAVHISPLTLHEALAFLDTVWRDAVRMGPLLSGDLLTAGGILATRCADAVDFREKLKALVDVFERIQVPNGRGRGKLAWLLEHLESWASSRDGAGDDLASLRDAISVLQKVGRVRAYYMHSDAGARSDFEAAQRALGIRLPAISYGEEWDRLVARVVEQLRVVREFLRKHGRS